MKLAPLISAWLVALGICGGTRAAEPRSEPDFAGWVEVARDARARGDLATALDALERAYALEPEASVLNNIAVTLEDLGRYADALATTRRLLQHPSLPTERTVEVQARIAELEPRAVRAWVEVVADPGDTATQADARATRLDGETALEPGDAALLVTMGRERALVHVTLETGRLTRIDVRRSELRRRFGALDLRGIAAPEARIDERVWTLRGPDASDRVWLDPGQHVVVVGAEQRLVQLSASEAAAVTFTRERSFTGPVVVGGIGAIGLAVGAALWLGAEADRDSLRSDLGTTRPVDGLARKRALAREEAADDAATAGFASIAVGGAVIIGAVVWLLTDDGTSRLAVSPGGVSWAW